MLGQVTVLNKELLVNILCKFKNIFSSLPGLKVVLQPVPRYLFGPCCLEEGHCTGTSEVGYAVDLLKKIMVVKKQLSDHLSAVYTNVCIPDSFAAMFPNCKSLGDIAAALKSGTASDNVHLTSEGYQLLTSSLEKVMESKSAASFSLSGDVAGEKPLAFYWRGFQSPAGAPRPANAASHHGNRSNGGGKWHAISTRTSKRGCGDPYPPRRRGK
jgi:hypothetical protein